MDLKDLLKKVAERINHKDIIATEEATKNAFIMPFLQALGYDVFNPFEVVPEFVSDIGLKKGEKIDYAIFKDGAPAILIECKHWAQALNLYEGQLLRYFHVSKAKFGILTNGITYQFYSDLVERNKMDEKPFLEFNITDLRDSHIEEIKKFHKLNFDIDRILNSASELKYTNEIRQLIQSEIHNPSAELVRIFAKKIYSGTLTAKVLDLFTVLTKKSYQHYISDLINDRLKTALIKEEEKMLNKEDELSKDSYPQNAKEEISKITTTEEELEAYFIVKSVLRQKVDASRIVYRDMQTYFSIILDDNNRKPICRLYFNTAKKYIAIFDESKKELKNEISSLDDIFDYAEQLTSTVITYELVKELV